MNRIKINEINYYVLLSVLIHSSLFLFVKKEKVITLGDKILPIEVVDNYLEAGLGESTKRSKRFMKRSSLKEESKKEKKNKKSSDQQKAFEDNKLNKNIMNEKTEQNQEKLNNISPTISEKKKGSGSKEGKKNFEPEKGSLRGIGRIKITCLKCIRPDYPPIALRKGAEGAPIIKVWINKKGKVFKAELISVSGIESIDRAAKKAAFNSTFYPLEEETSINIEYDLKIR